MTNEAGFASAVVTLQEADARAVVEARSAYTVVNVCNTKHIDIATVIARRSLLLPTSTSEGRAGGTVWRESTRGKTAVAWTVDMY